MSHLDPITSLDDPIEEPERDPYAGRLLAFRLVIILAFCLLSAQLWRLQVVEGDQYRERADNNRFRLTRIEPSRGVLYDRNGIILVRNMPSYTVTIIPADLPDEPEPVFKRLGTLLGKSPQSIAELVLLPPKGKRDTDAFTPVPVETNVSREMAFTIEERHLDLPGVHVSVESIREYLDGPLTSHIIGYVRHISPEQYERLKSDTEARYAMNDRLGQTGLELVYESVLRGKVGEKQMEVDSAGREVRTLAVQEPVPGHNLRLTIDLALQREIHRIASAHIDQYKSISVVAMNPRDGQILAMVSLPTYDNNLFSGKISAVDFERLVNDPARPLVNHAISDVYPPGSTFKIITAAGALQDKVVAPWTKFSCGGSMFVTSAYGNSRFVCWLAYGHGQQDVISGMADSCDIYFYHLGGGSPKGDQPGLDVEGLAKWSKLFGLGEPTGVDLPGEAVGNVPTREWKKQTWNDQWYLGDTYNMAIGQGFVTATPLQMVNVVAAAVNGGTLYQPQLVREITDAEGKEVRSFAPKVIRDLPISKENLDYIKQGLRANMLTGTTPWGTSYTGTAYTAEVRGINMGGKTGTAEYGTPDASGKLPTHGWFVCAAPIDNPEVAMVVFVENGRGAQEAAELAEEIMRYYFRVPVEKN
ncbi:MAG: penicillin-binding protein 2 [Chloroflexota bacterium]